MSEIILLDGVTGLFPNSSLTWSNGSDQPNEDDYLLTGWSDPLDHIKNDGFGWIEPQHPQKQLDTASQVATYLQKIIKEKYIV